jgi:hypothetical protein
LLVELVETGFDRLNPPVSTGSTRRFRQAQPAIQAQPAGR